MPDVHLVTAARPSRVWRPLSAALAYTATRDQNFAGKVELTRGSGQSIGIKFALRRARGDAKFLPGLETASKAWVYLRGLIEDGKVPARGTAIDRRGQGPRGVVDTEYPPGELPPHAVSGLVLRDEKSGETWLKPKDGPFGQGRFWKDVSVHWGDLEKALVGDSVPKRNKRSYQLLKIKRAYDAEIAAGAKADELLSLRPVELRKILSKRMKDQGAKDSEIPEQSSFRRFPAALRAGKLG